jgi:protoheme IX farnesyltransferase
MVLMLFKALIDLVKPKQTLLLLFTALASYTVAVDRQFMFSTFMLLAVSGVLLISGVTVFNMVLEVDIDRIMERTRRRPIPSGVMGRSYATLYGVIIYVLGLILACMINAWVVLAGVLALVFDIVLYTLWLKRRLELSIIVGGVAGGMPAFGGWCAAVGYPTIESVLVAVLVMLWIPMHIWFIAYYYREDYRRANIPMLPVTRGVKVFVKAVMISSFLFLFTIVLMYARGVSGLITLMLSVFITALTLKRMISFQSNPSEEFAKKLFKVASPYLIIVFFSMIIEKTLLL